MNAESISARLEAVSSVQVARATQKQVQTIRGVRGTPAGEVARILAESWRKERPQLPRDEDALGELFGTAWEDGLVAIGLLAALGPDRPDEVLEIGCDWLARLDELQTADAIGWLVLGPAALAAGADLGEFLPTWRAHPHPAARRAVVMMGMAMTPSRVEGPAAAALRERAGAKEVRFVEAPVREGLAGVGDAFVRDEDPHVRKALRRVLGTWAEHDPEGATAWMNAVRGGVPKMIRDEVEKSARKGLRRAARPERHAAPADDAEPGASS